MRNGLICVFVALTSLAAPPFQPALWSGPKAKHASEEVELASRAVSRVLASPEGRPLAKSTVLEVLYRQDRVERVYLLNARKNISSFWISPKGVALQWSSRLLPVTSQDAQPPTGALGRYLEKRGLRIASLAHMGRQSHKAAYFRDLDNPTPIRAYRWNRGGALVPIAGSERAGGSAQRITAPDANAADLPLPFGGRFAPVSSGRWAAVTRTAR